jgi:hypothetical protein
MAQVNISFDTVQKNCSVTIDGQDLPDVEWVSIGKFGDEASLSIELGAVKQDGMTIRTHVSASEGARVEGQKTSKIGDTGLVTYEKDDLGEAAMEWLLG